MPRRTTASISIIAAASSTHSEHLHRTTQRTFLTLRLTGILKIPTAAGITISCKTPTSNPRVLPSLQRWVRIITQMKKTLSALCLQVLHEKGSVIMTTPAGF
jgi:hypothetical protein